MSDRYALLRALLKEREAADYRINDLLRVQFPLGSEIRWCRSGSGKPILGIVLAHGYRDRIRVKNLQTERSYWIHAHDVYGTIAARSSADA
ncbi:hypothetical protein [Rhodopseudomonas sp. RCAM05734]|uniref:hypothetical protein n=1 Tax=Rhodopseudomonas sp. RCAM05734 TaxID=3457549 RepID=UPI004043FDC1